MKIYRCQFLCASRMWKKPPILAIVFVVGEFFGMATIIDIYILENINFFMHIVSKIAYTRSVFWQLTSVMMALPYWQIREWKSRHIQSFFGWWSFGFGFEHRSIIFNNRWLFAFSVKLRNPFFITGKMQCNRK